MTKKRTGVGKVGLENLDIFQQREHADDDDDDADDLFRAAVNRQHVDEIKNQNDDKKCNENADQQAHGLAPYPLQAGDLIPAENIIAWLEKSSNLGTGSQAVTG
jgi:hypothetical protein